MTSDSNLNINTPEYWNEVYWREWNSNQATSATYHRDYGPIHDAIIGLIPDGSRVLDIACGPGILCRKIKQRLPDTRVIGVDFSEYTVMRNMEFDHDLGVEYRCLDIHSGFASLPQEFDVITMCEIIEHLNEPAGIVANAVNLLRNGGLFILSCPHDNEIPDPEHLRQWGHDELFHLLAPYSDTISFTHFEPPYFHAWMLAYFTRRSVSR